MIKNVRDHVDQLYLAFTNPVNKVFQEELQNFRVDLVEYMTKFNISDPIQRDQFIRCQGQLELLDTWIKMPEATNSYLKELTASFNKFKSSVLSKGLR
jgi:hypothetical protein